MNFEEMPFGKHKGTCIDQLPASYIEWILENTDVDGWLRHQLEKSYEFQLYGGTNNGDPSHVIKSAFQDCAKKWHPDKGGTHEAMVAVNEFHELIIKGLDENK
jgi:uncharacterized protein (DUF3820 family)